MNAVQVFSRAVSRLNIARNLPVAVAVSGGCDSMALTYLAKQVFDRVVGITVDHKLREGSSEEAERTCQHVTSLGVEQHTVTLDWGDQGIPPPGKVQVLAREKRYTTLLNLCRDMDINTLMLAHHQDDQNETFLYRLAMGSGIDGLGGMSPLTSWPGFPLIEIVRPLLELHKRDLVEVCQCEGVEWVEDPTNLSTKYVRNHYRQVLRDRPELVEGIERLVRSCDKARSVAHRQVRQHVLNLPKINTKNGYLSVDLDTLRSLPPPVAKRVLNCLLRYISASDRFLSYKDLNNTYTAITCRRGFKAVSGGKALIMALGNGRIGIAKATQSGERNLTPVQLGDTILWDGRWEITLKAQIGTSKSQVKILKSKTRPREGNQLLVSQPNTDSVSDTDNNKHTNSEGVDEGNVYFVRHMVKKDWEYAVRGVRRIRNATLPHVNIRGSLPVIVDKNGRVVLIPHFQFRERMINVTAELAFKPKNSLEDIVNSLTT